MRNTYSPEFKAKVVREVLREDKTLSKELEDAIDAVDKLQVEINGIR